MQAVTITLTATCDTAGAQQIPSDQPGTRRFERPLSLAPQFSDIRYYTFPGGCATYQFLFAPGASPVLAAAVDSALSFTPGPRWSATSGAPRTWPCAGEAPDARDDPQATAQRQDDALLGRPRSRCRLRLGPDTYPPCPG